MTASSETYVIELYGELLIAVWLLRRAHRGELSGERRVLRGRRKRDPSPHVPRRRRKPLAPPGSLPTYAEHIEGGNANGLAYLDVTLPSRLYYALKHRESKLMVGLSGPLDQLQTARTVVDPMIFFLPQTQFAFAAVDGYTAAIQTVPAAGVIFGGFQDPNIWDTPVSDEVTFTIPSDAQPGTYVAVVKARRDYSSFVHRGRGRLPGQLNGPMLRG